MSSDSSILHDTIDEAIRDLSLSAESDEELKAILDSIPGAVEDLVEYLPDSILETIQRDAKSGLNSAREDYELFVARNESRWKQGFDQLELLIHVATETGELFNERCRPSAAESGDQLFDVVVRLHAKGCLVSKEILALLKNGFADGAHARWRALHELSVTATFLAKHGPDAAQRYVDHEAVQAYKAAAQLNKFESRINSSGFSGAELEEFKAHRDDVIQRYGTDFKDDYGWAHPFITTGRANFAALELNVGLDHWRPYYKWASQNIHANVKTIRSSLGLSEATSDMLQAGPSNSGMTDPAHSTAISLVNLTCSTVSTSPNLDNVIAVRILTLLSDQVGSAFAAVD